MSQNCHTNPYVHGLCKPVLKQMSENRVTSKYAVKPCLILTIFSFCISIHAAVESAVPQAPIASAYLIVDDQTIYEVAPNSVLNIGRLDTNDIVLDDYKVSREHAVLKFGKNGMTLVDLASTHGSFVNDARIDRCNIHYGDRIRVVSHEILVCEDKPQALLTDTGSVIMPRMARNLDRRIKFFGGLNEFSLLTLVQFLSHEKQSGLLLLELGQNPGPRIYIKDGEIIHVTQGEDLADLLIRQQHDQSLFFYFHHETHFPERTITQPTANYLMDLCHSHDERKQQNIAAQPETWTTRSLSVTGRVPVPIS